MSAAPSIFLSDSEIRPERKRIEESESASSEAMTAQTSVKAKTAPKGSILLPVFCITALSEGKPAVKN